MAKVQQSAQPLNAADGARIGLADAETLLASAATAHEFATLLAKLDGVRSALDLLDQAHVDIRAEKSRLESLGHATTRRARAIVTGMGGEKAYRAARPPGSLASWWHLDALLAAERVRMRKWLGAALATLVAVVGLAYLFRDTLFPVNPVRDAITDAEIALRDNRQQDAVAAIERGLEITATNAELSLWRGVLAEKLGDSAQAKARYDSAAAVLSRRQLLTERSQIYLRAGMLDLAMADLDAAIGSTDTGAEAYFLRASAWEGRRDAALRANDVASSRLAYQQALADLEKAAALAEKDGQDALVATSRMRMAMLLQQAGP